MDENTTVASLPPLNDVCTLLVRFFFNLQPSSSFKHLSIPFVLEEGTVLDGGMKDFSVTTLPADEIRHFVRSVDRSLIF